MMLFLRLEVVQRILVAKITKQVLWREKKKGRRQRSVRVHL
jgi:hypothetical protein